MARRAWMRVAAVFAWGVTSCRFTGPPPSPVVEAAARNDALFIAPSRIEIPRGYSPSQVVSVRTFSGGTPHVTWSSSNPAIVSTAELDSRSVELTGRAGGSAIITAKASDGRTASAEVLVTMDPPTRWNPVAPSEVLVDGLRVRASTQVDSTPASTIKGAVLYTTTATITNRSSTRRTLSLGACSLWLTIHAGGGWSKEEMRPLAWDQLLTDAVCSEKPKTVRLSPGASHSIRTRVFAHDLATKLTPNDRYFFHAHVRFDTTEVVVDADSAVISYPNANLAAVASTTIVGADTTQSIRTEISLTNIGALPAYVEFGQCGVRVLAYRNADRTGAPAWDSNKSRPWRGSHLRVCLMYLLTTTVPPGGVLAASEFTARSPLIEILADSLPDGRYYFSADVGFSNRVPILGIPAGSLDLTLRRQPLPASRASDLLTLTANPVVVSGSTVSAHAIAKLEYAGGGLVTFSRDCPIAIYAYRDRGRRDAAPRSGAADWTQPVSCGSAADTASMKRGDARAMETTVAVRNILGSSLPSGRYYFAVVVRAQGNRVFLSAGEADLAR